MVEPGTTAPARERILDAAEELFYAQGIAATGVDAVLRSAGASPASLYAHFAGKDGLVAGYLERRHARWRETWDAALAAADEPVERVLSLFDAVADFRGRQGATRGCAVLAAAVELSRADHPGREWVEADTRLLRQRLHDLTLALGLDPDDVEVLVDELVLVYDGALAAFARGATDPLPRARSLARAAIERRCTDDRAAVGYDTEVSHR